MIDEELQSNHKDGKRECYKTKSNTAVMASTCEKEGRKTKRVRGEMELSEFKAKYKHTLVSMRDRFLLLSQIIETVDGSKPPQMTPVMLMIHLSSFANILLKVFFFLSLWNRKQTMTA